MGRLAHGGEIRKAMSAVRRRHLFGAGMVLGLLCVHPALAAGSEATTVDTLIVQAARQNRDSGTGSKTDTPVVEIPQGVSVVTSDQLDTLKTVTLSNVLNYVPGLLTQPETNARYADQVIIRGFTADPATGNFLRDGLKLQPNAYDGGQEGYGLERVDVLRGAASVLYGQVSPAGVVNAISKKPTWSPLAEAEVELGTYDRRQIAADVSGPVPGLSDVAVRLTALGRKSDTSVDYINDDKAFVAPAVTWRIRENATLTLLSFYNDVSTKFSAPLPLVGTLIALPTGRIPEDRFVGEPAYDHFHNQSYAIGDLFDGKLGDSLTFHQGFRVFHSHTDIDYLQVASIAANNRTLNRSVVNRVDLSTGEASDTYLTWKAGPTDLQNALTAGLDYYQRVYDTHRWGGSVAGLDFLAPAYGAPVTVSRAVDTGSKTVSNQTGLYAQDQLKLYKHLVLLAGGRYDWSEQRVLSYRNFSVTRQDDKAATGRIGAVYLFDSGLAPYASFAQSFQPSIGTDRLGATFKPTRGEQVEAGVRYVPPDGLAVLTASVYDLKQDNVLTTDPANTAFQVQTGQVRSRGLELEAKTQLFDALNLVASYTYTDARTTKTNIAANLGKRVAAVPYNTASIWADYRFDKLGLPGLRLGGAVRYVGTTDVIRQQVDTPAYTLIDLYGSYERDNWRLALNIKNVGDRSYFYCNTNTVCRYGDPREAIVTLSYRY